MKTWNCIELNGYCFRLMQRILWCSFVFSNLIKWLAIYKLNLWKVTSLIHYYIEKLNTILQFQIINLLHYSTDWYHNVCDAPT